MNIWFYLFLIVLCISIFLLLKLILMKKEIKNISNTLLELINLDTNNLITINTNDKALVYLANTLNRSLKELRKLELEYKNGNGELKSSITNISHDLRTPLTAIRGYLDLIEENNLSDKQISYLKTIDCKVRDLIFLTEQLFDFSKSIDIQPDMKKENISINTILENSIASFYSLFKEHEITPIIEICEEEVIRFLNETMLKRIFENIISNAIKYSDGDFNVKMFPNGTIEFSNTTKEIDSTSLEKIFDRYYTVQNARKSNGIGLSIAKQLVDFSGGKIEAKYSKEHLMIKVQF